MKPIPTEFSYNGFNYKQIRREGDVAVYQQILGKNPSYEVIIVQKHNGYTINGVTYPPAEFYPSTNDWGTKGWTIFGWGDQTRQKAIDKMHQVLQNIENKKNKKKKNDPETPN